MPENFVEMFKATVPFCSCCVQFVVVSRKEIRAAIMTVAYPLLSMFRLPFPFKQNKVAP